MPSARRTRPRSTLAPGRRSRHGLLWAQLETGSLAAGIALENRTQVTAVLTSDHKEAVRAFLEKRPPTFTGR
jgi:enoyl-CoA hydratase